ncbi:hypothetical protein MMC16_003971 [Acarospora aff. strigata]|nr:hypothetical protein [Acarospora aff. strigata]
MNDILQSQLDRVETALNTLIDSITSYNPSIPAAIDLLSADDDLTKGLEQPHHQANHAHILSLRNTASALDTQLKTSLTLLAETRKELLATPATTFPPASRDVPYHELLAYAKHISKFTVPPTIRPPPEPSQQIQSQTTAAQGDPAQAKDTTEAQQPNGVNGNDAASKGTTAVTVADDNTKTPGGIGVSSLAASESQWLDPSAQIPFVPWPTEEVIRRGALAQIQVMLEQGVDPAGAAVPKVDLEQEQEEETEMEVEVKRENEGGEEARRKSAVASAAAGKGRAEGRREEKEKPAVFGGLDLYDPDDE